MIKKMAASLLALIFFAFFGASALAAEDDYIKWMSFSPSYTALSQTLNADISAHRAGKSRSWIELLAYLAVQYGGNFSRYRAKDLDTLLQKLDEGKSAEELTYSQKDYFYYLEAYTAVLGNFIGTYQTQESDSGKLVTKYGLKAFFPLAKNYGYSHSNDFGDGRSFGYDRRHLGHDLMTQTGAPVIAAESGRVEALGWNQYGGWRVGIRSLDHRRYYYYAHFRSSHPYQTGLAAGGLVQAGDVIGYVGRSGYSTKENTNNMKLSHLHFGIQIIFHQSQKSGAKEIWINPYAITELLARNKCETVKSDIAGESRRRYSFSDLSLRSPSDSAPASAQPEEAPPRTNQTRVPIIMYHLVSKSRQNKYSISPAEFESDLQYLKSRGYHTVVMRDIIDYVYAGKPLPENPVALTFDDGNTSDYEYVYPLLVKYDMKAVAAVIGKVTEDYTNEGKPDARYPNLLWSQAKEMQQSGYVEIQDHSYNLHRGAGYQKRKGEKQSDYEQRIKDDLIAMQRLARQRIGVIPSTLVYPFGALSKTSEEAARELGFSATLSCLEGINILTVGDPDCLFHMKRNIRPHGRSAEQVLAKAAKTHLSMQLG